MSPREADPLTVEDEAVAAFLDAWRTPQMIVVPPPDRPAPLIGFLLAAFSGALVGGLLMFAVGRASAAPRSAPAYSGTWTLLEAPHGASPFAPPSTNGTRPASGEASPDLRTPPATSVQSGIATWCAPTPRYCHGWGGKVKLAAVPSFRWGDDPYIVKVCRQDRPGTCVTAKVVSYCACPGSRIVDLSVYAFERLAPKSVGVLPVTVTVDYGGPSVTPPATDR